MKIRQFFGADDWRAGVALAPGQGYRVPDKSTDGTYWDGSNRTDRWAYKCLTSKNVPGISAKKTAP